MKHWTILFILSLPAFLGAQDYLTKKTVNKKIAAKYKKAVQLSRSKQYDDAYKAPEKLLKKTPRFVDAELMQAAILYDQERYPQAEQKYERVLGYAPNHRTRTYYELALVELKQEKYEEAIQHLEQFLQLETKNEKLRVRANKHLQRAHFVAQAVKTPVPFTPEPRRSD